MSEVTARQHGWGRALVLPLVLCGFLLLPFVLLAAHGLPGHATAMSTSVSTGSQHGEHGPGVLAEGQSSTSHGAIGSDNHEHHKDAPLCDAGPDNSTVATCRPLSHQDTDLEFLFLSVVVATAIIEPFAVWPRLRELLRWWRAKPNWRASGTSLLSLACVFRI